MSAKAATKKVKPPAPVKSDLEKVTTSTLPRLWANVFVRGVQAATEDKRVDKLSSENKNLPLFVQHCLPYPPPVKETKPKVKKTEEQKAADEAARVLKKHQKELEQAAAAAAKAAGTELPKPKVERKPKDPNAPPTIKPTLVSLTTGAKDFIAFMITDVLKNLGELDEQTSTAIVAESMSVKDLESVSGLPDVKKMECIESLTFHAQARKMIEIMQNAGITTYATMFAEFCLQNVRFGDHLRTLNCNIGNALSSHFEVYFAKHKHQMAVFALTLITTFLKIVALRVVDFSWYSGISLTVGVLQGILSVRDAHMDDMDYAGDHVHKLNEKRAADRKKKGSDDATDDVTDDAAGDADQSEDDEEQTK